MSVVMYASPERKANLYSFLREYSTVHERGFDDRRPDRIALRVHVDAVPDIEIAAGVASRIQHRRHDIDVVESLVAGAVLANQPVRDLHLWPLCNPPLRRLDGDEIDRQGRRGREDLLAELAKRVAHF